MGLKDKAGLFSVPNLKTVVVVIVSGELEGELSENTILLSDVEEPKLKDGMSSLVASNFLRAATLEVMVGVGGDSSKASEVKETGKVKLMPFSQLLRLLSDLAAATGVS